MAPIHGRAANDQERWLDAFLGAWNEAGAPTNFRFIVGESLDDWGDRVLQPIAEADDIRAAMVGATDQEWSHAPLLRLLARGWIEGGADALAIQALESLKSVTSLEDQLWARALHAQLAQQYPGEFLLASLTTLDEGSEECRALTSEQLRLLSTRAESHQGAVNIHSVYRHLVDVREASSADDRSGCLLDASAMLPDPLLDIFMRARASFEQGAERPDMIRLALASVAAPFVSSPHVSRRLVALSLRHLAYTPGNETDSTRAAEPELELARKVSDARNRIHLDWPIEPLRREVMDATAEDEWALMMRARFPARSFA